MNTKKTISLSIILLFVHHLAMGKNMDRMDQLLNWTYKNIIIVFVMIIVLGVVLSIARLLFDLIDKQKDDLLLEDTAQEDASNSISWWEKLSNRAWNLIPMDRESDIMLEHDFDGIHELDNKLPPWWLYLFFLTIIWAGVYFYMFQFSSKAVSQEEEYYAAMQVAKEAKRKYAASQANAVDEYTVVALTDDVSLELGQKAFDLNCATCHGFKGEGIVGPNLTDAYWLHGGATKDIFKTIKYGVPEKGMIAWKAQLSPSAIQNITSYIESIQGTDPENAKEKEGILYDQTAKQTGDESNG